MFAWQICCEPQSDSHRFMDAIDAACEAGDVQRYAAYSKWAKATAKQPRPKSPLTRKKKRKQGADESALVAQIRHALCPARVLACPTTTIHVDCIICCDVAALTRWQMQTGVALRGS